MFLDFFIFITYKKFLIFLFLFLIFLFLFLISILFFENSNINFTNTEDINNLDVMDNLEQLEQDEEDTDTDTDNKDDDKKKNNNSNNLKDKDLDLLKSLDDSKDPNLHNFKIHLVEVKRCFGAYWNNYYNWHYKYNGNYSIFNWYRFNKWMWSTKDYDNLKKKSDSDFLKLKISWLKFQEAYLKISRNSSYHALVTKIYLKHYDLLQLIKNSIKNNFSKK